MAKKVPVTSVTPAIKTKAVSKAQQARTRALVMGIATATPVGRGAKAVATAAKVVKDEAVMAKAGWNAAAKAGYRADVKRGVYSSTREQKKAYKEKVTIPAKRVVAAAKAEMKANERALKAANKPVSKGNRNIGGPVVRNIIKNSPPARANRTRLGNPAKSK